MGVFQLLIRLIEHFGLIVAGCFILMRLGAFRKIIVKRANTTEKVLITLFFGGFGIVGTYMGVPVLDAIANLRGMSCITAGLLGGPLVGMGAGLIAGGHRYMLGGFSAFPCGLATLVEGLLAGMVSNYLKQDKLDWKTGFIFGVVGESLHMLIVLLIGRPFPDAFTLVQVVALPMILVNAIGIAVLIEILNGIFREEEKAGAIQAQKALNIATKTVGYLRTGLNIESAGETVKIIHKTTDIMTVGITDRHQILACVGAGEDHHNVGKERLASATIEVIKTGEYKIIRNKAEVGCPVPDCPLYCGMVVPLKKKGNVVGTLSLYRGKGSRISQVDIELATGLAHLFSIQLELEEIQHQAQLLDRAEIKALQAQINPHFFFNALNSIVSFCRTDIEKARELLINLGDFFRSTLNSGNRDLISLEEELDHLKSYLMIEEARFGNRIKVFYRLNHGKDKWYVPQFTLQPLVENAIKHGLSSKDEGGIVTIETRRLNGALQILIEDNGKGIPSEELKGLLKSGVYSKAGCGIALTNINQRLISLYGPEYEIKIESTEGSGTRACLMIPQNTLIDQRKMAYG
ncbi:MAG: sensor histidine kinase [Deltaproteobacteria bacterium]|nr:sensor histidine kinase [Deltaproteobacteria bacterium]